MKRRLQRKLVKARKTVQTMAKTANRSCGPCTVCCTVYGVSELKKDPGVPCQHKGQGCTIYEKRPPTCEEFDCLWKLGLGSPEDRPDLLGIVFDVADARGEQAIVAREHQEGAFERAQPLLEHLAKTLVVFLLQGDSRKIIGPTDKVEQILKRTLRVVP